MGNFLHYLKIELKALLRPIMLVPLLSGAVIVAAACIIINIVILNPPKINQIAVLDNDNSANSSALSSWFDTSNLQVQRFFNKRAMYVRNDLNTRGINVAVEIPSGFSRTLINKGQAFLNTYCFINDLTVKSAMRENVITYAIFYANNWARDKKLNKVEIENSVSRFDYFISGQHITGVKNAQLFKDFSSRAINLQIAVLILVIFSFLFMTFKTLPKKYRMQLDPADTDHHRFTLISAKMVSSLIPALVLSAIYVIFFNRFIYGFLGDKATPQTVKALALSFGPAGILLLCVSLIISTIVAMSLPLILSNIRQKIIRALLVVIFALGLFFGPFLVITIFDSENFFVNNLPFSNSFMIPANVYLKNYMEILSGFTWQLLIFAAVLILAKIITVKLFKNPTTPANTNSEDPFYKN